MRSNGAQQLEAMKPLVIPTSEMIPAPLAIVNPQSHLERQFDVLALNRLADPKPRWLKDEVRRSLGGGGDGKDAFQSVLVDSDGNAYEPYAIAWRYLGLYIDCDDDDDEEGADDDDGEGRRLSGDHGDDEDCSRKLLWAAVRCIGRAATLLNLAYYWLFCVPQANLCCCFFPVAPFYLCTVRGSGVQRWVDW